MLNKLGRTSGTRNDLPISVCEFFISVIGNRSAPLTDESALPSRVFVRVRRVIVPPDEEQQENEDSSGNQRKERQRK